MKAVQSFAATAPSFNAARTPAPSIMPPATTFVVVDEVEMEDWGVGGHPVDEYRRSFAGRDLAHRSTAGIAFDHPFAEGLCDADRAAAGVDRVHPVQDVLGRYRDAFWDAGHRPLTGDDGSPLLIAERLEAASHLTDQSPGRGMQKGRRIPRDACG